jgi:uncharacterized Ntn-hydrolase superfamily protein
MTYCLVCRHADAFGGIVATAGPCVGGFVLHGAPGIGFVATQGYSTNTLYGPGALRLLEGDHSAAQVCRTLTAEDAGRSVRQLVVVDRFGNTDAWTGEDNRDYKGHRLHKDLAVAGNWLRSAAVLEAMEAAYSAGAGTELHLRLLAALRAGLDAGGDSRGTSSAALKIVYMERPPMDIRVDYDKAPVARLAELIEVLKDEDYQRFLKRIPRPNDPFRY